MELFNKKVLTRIFADDDKKEFIGEYAATAVTHVQGLEYRIEYFYNFDEDDLDDLEFAINDIIYLKPFKFRGEDCFLAIKTEQE